MTAREWRINPPHIHGTVEDEIGGREIRICDGCGAAEGTIGVPDKQLPHVPAWPGFLEFVQKHTECVRSRERAEKERGEKQ